MLATTIAAFLALPLSIDAPGLQDAARPATTDAKPDAKWAEGPAIPKLRFVRLFPNLALVRPIQALQAKGDANGLLVVEQPGRILRADLATPDAADAPVFLDIRERVHDGGNEEGLLSVAFHPDYPEKRELFVYYTAKDPRRSKLSRFTVAADGLSADPASEETILEQSQPYSNHNGGAAVFGPDGHLYLSLGDGGAANDPHHYAQDLSTFLGKVLRIDVNAKSDGLAYAVPADNPFVGREGARPEIWAYGTRNIWRMAFDPKTGDLWAGDVGQNIWEEVDLIVKGGNYGWNAREGAHDFKGGKGEPPFIEPVVEYHHREGMSITGGRVYRGAAYPALDGVYVYADFISSNVWGIRMIDGRPTKPAIVARKRGDLIASIDELHDGTLVVPTFDQDQKRGNPGSLWKLVAAE